MKNIKKMKFKLIEKDYEVLTTKLLDIINTELDGKTHSYVTNVGVNSLITLMANFANGYTNSDPDKAIDFLALFAQKTFLAFMAIKRRDTIMERAH